LSKKKDDVILEDTHTIMKQDTDEEGWTTIPIKKKTGGRKPGAKNKTKDELEQRKKSVNSVGRPKGTELAARDSKQRKLSFDPKLSVPPVPAQVAVLESTPVQEKLVSSPAQKRKEACFEDDKVYTERLTEKEPEPVLNPEDFQPLNRFRDLVQITGTDLDEMPSTAVKRAARGDGNCLIHSVIISSGVTAKDKSMDLPTLLRLRMVQVMRDNYELFELVHNQSMPADNFEAYLVAMSMNETYCDDLCVTALSIVMKSNIHVYRQQLGTPLVSVWKFSPVLELGCREDPIIVWNLIHPTVSAAADHFDALEFNPEYNQVPNYLTILRNSMRGRPMSKQGSKQ
jgi:hypothetical protein